MSLPSHKTEKPRTMSAVRGLLFQIFMEIGLCRSSSPAHFFADGRFSRAVASISLMRFSWLTRVAEGS